MAPPKTINFRMPGTSTAVSDYLYNAKLAIRNIGARPHGRSLWQEAFDRLHMLGSSGAGWKLTSPLVHNLVCEASQISSMNSKLAADASAGLFVLTTRFPDSKAFSLSQRLVQMTAHYSRMEGNYVRGNQQLKLGYSEADHSRSREAVWHFYYAGHRFLRSGFALGAFYAFSHANALLLQSFDSLPSSEFLNKQAKVRSNIEKARALALSSNVSPAHGKKYLKYSLSGPVLDPLPGSTPAGLTDKVIRNPGSLN